MGASSAAWALAWYITYLLITLGPVVLLAVLSTHTGFYNYVTSWAIFLLLFLYYQVAHARPPHCAAAC
jgi:hypothetical protein